MGIRIGIIDYDRPSKPVNADEVKKLLSVAGKDVIRLAWQSLNPDGNNYIKIDALASWLCVFFNMKQDENNGRNCIYLLRKMDLLEESYSRLRPRFEI